jgi:hypothetical protein
MNYPRQFTLRLHSIAEILARLVNDLVYVMERENRFPLKAPLSTSFPMSPLNRSSWFPVWVLPIAWTISYLLPIPWALTDHIFSPFFLVPQKGHFPSFFLRTALGGFPLWELLLAPTIFSSFPTPILPRLFLLLTIHLPTTWLQPCRWRQHVSQKRGYLPTSPHCVTTQNTNIDNSRRAQNWGMLWRTGVLSTAWHSMSY